MVGSDGRVAIVKEVGKLSRVLSPADQAEYFVIRECCLCPAGNSVGLWLLVADELQRLFDHARTVCHRGRLITIAVAGYLDELTRAQYFELGSVLKGVRFCLTIGNFCRFVEDVQATPRCADFGIGVGVVNHPTKLLERFPVLIQAPINIEAHNSLRKYDANSVTVGE